MSEQELFSIFNAIPTPCLILRPDFPHFTMVDGNDARLRATMTRREDFIGKKLFDVFPDNPDDPQATGVANLTASLMTVLKDKKTHQMAVQKYDIPFPDKSGFELRYWQPKNIPIFNDSGEITYLLHMVEDVTSEVLLKQEKQKSNLYESLFVKHPDLVFFLDLNGYFTRVNQAAVQLSEYPEEKLLTMHFTELCLPDDIDRLQTYFIQCCTGFPSTLQASTLSASGKRYELNLSIMPLYFDGEVQGIYGTAKDVTEQVKYLKEKQMISQFREIFNQELELPDCLTDVLKVLGSLTNSHIVEAWVGNIDNTEIMLTSSVCLDGMLYHGERITFDRAEGLVGTAWKSGEITRIARLQTNKNYLRPQYARANNLQVGVAVPIIYKSEVIAVFVFNYQTEPQEIEWLSEGLTAQLANEIQRKKSEYELNQFFNLSPDMLAIVGYDGCFKKINSVFSQVLGYTTSELLANPFLEFIHPEDRKATEAEFKRLLEKVPIEAFENRYVTKDGDVKWLSWTSNPSKHDRMVFAIARDVTERKKLEQAYQSEQQRFARLFEEAPVSMCILKGKDHVYQHANPAFYKLTGKSDIVGKSVIEAFPEMGVQEIPAWLDRVYQTGETFTAFEAPVQLGIDDTGQLRQCYLSFMYQPYKNSGGETEGVFYFGIDVTEQVEARKKARESEKRYLDLIENLPVAVYATDTEGKLTLFNRAFVALVGEEHAIGENLTYPAWRLNPEGGEMNFSSDTNGAVHDLPGKPTEIIVRSKHGNRRHVIWHPTMVYNTNGEASGSINVLIDYTERKRVENDFRKLSLIARNTDNAVIITDVEGQIEWVNEAFSRMTGYEFAEVIGKTKAEVLDGDETDKSIGRILAEEPEQAHVQYEAVNYTKSGAPFWAEVRHQPLYDPSGKIINFFDIATDITLRKQAHDKLVTSEFQVRSFAKQLNTVLEEERARIAREIHDEFGQQLAGLKLVILSLENYLAVESRGVLDGMLERVDLIIKSLRRFATELRPGILDTLGLVPSIEWLVKDFEQKTGIVCDLKLKRNQKPIDNHISICCFRICQEALTNIIKHSAATYVVVELEITAKRLFLRVADNGKGMTIDNSQYPFSMGILGMRERANLVGGNLFINSFPGKGTTVDLLIEVAHENADINS